MGNSENYSIAELINYAKNARIPLRTLNNTNTSYKTFYKYTKEDITSYLSSPDRNSKNLVQASVYLYNVSSHYRRLINYFAKMPVYAYSIIPYKYNSQKVSPDKFMTAYQKAADQLEILNMSHEFLKVLTTAFREDAFYGYEYSTKDSYTIKQLNSEQCNISSIEDGCYCFEFDFSYFDSHQNELVNYGTEFQEKYQLYKDGSALKWQELDPKRTICIKIQEDLSYVLPPFAGVFPSIYDIEDYKALIKTKSEIENYKMLAMKIPMKGSVPEIEWDIAKAYHKQFEAALPDYIGSVLTPMDISPFNFERSNTNQNTDYITQAENQYWSSAGTSGLLFGEGDNPSSSTIKLSLKSDEEIIFAVMRQLERWVNRKLKSLSGTVKFKIKFLDVTAYNQDDKFNQIIKGAQYSLPLKMAAYSILGFEPSDIAGMSYLENTVLKLQDNLVPLQSSYTQTNESQGRATNESKGEDLTEAGEQTAENDTNENR